VAKPTLILLPHLSLFETIATSPAFRPSASKKLGAIYRPNSNPSIDKWINKSRMDLGLKVFSRKKGLIQAKKHLKDGNWLILLFDQNAGIGGELSLFLNRICSVSPLPDIVVKGMPANVVLATPFRSSFFRG
jgi:lauroyl/myristoyl acyltransferase